MPSDLVWSKLRELHDRALKAIAGASDVNALISLQKQYLGKKGEVQAYMQIGRAHV